MPGAQYKESITAIQPRMLKRLAQLGQGKTMCPGRLARDCGSDLKSVRADLLSLAHGKKVMLSQNGQPVRGDRLKGPFRVRLTAASVLRETTDAPSPSL